MQRHDDASCSFTDARDLWAPTPATTFMVRSLDYARTKQKVNSSEAIYRLVAVDLFSFQKKQTHVAQLVQLPAPAPQRHVSAPDTYLPPLLVVNIMLPMYAVSTRRLSAVHLQRAYCCMERASCWCPMQPMGLLQCVWDSWPRPCWPMHACRVHGLTASLGATPSTYVHLP